MNENQKRLPRATPRESGQTAIVKLLTTNRGLPFKVSIAPESLQVHNHWVTGLVRISRITTAPGFCWFICLM